MEKSPENNTDKERGAMEEKKSLHWVTKLSYGVGHVFSDLAGAMWFSYFIIFVEKVLQYEPKLAGALMLVGQTSNFATTPIVGIFADKENKIPLCARYGRRKIWHLAGTVFMFVSFPIVFSDYFVSGNSSEWQQVAYHAIFVAIYQVGGACCLISHLALVPDLTSKKHQRTELNSIRYSFTVLSYLGVFAGTFFVLNIEPSSDVLANCNSTVTETAVSGIHEECNINTVGPEDATKFRNIALTVASVGILFGAIFHLGLREPSYEKRSATKDSEDREVKSPQYEKIPTDASKGEVYPDGDVESEVKPERKMRKIDWLKEIQFYQVIILYVVSRLFVVLYQVYIPLFIQETLLLSKTFIAAVPFIMYLSGFLGSVAMKRVNEKLGRKGTFSLGCSIGLGACLWIWVGEGSYFTQWGIFVVAGLLGVAGSTLFITSFSITADYIGSNVEGGAFVYGASSLVDKISNGISIMIIQSFNPNESWYYREVITFACGSSCIIGILVTVSLINVRVGKRRGSSPTVSATDEVYDEPETGNGNTQNPGSDTKTERKYPDDSHTSLLTKPTQEATMT